MQRARSSSRNGFRYDYFCFLNQVFHVYAIPCRTDGESFGITGGRIIVCNFGFVMIVYA